MEDERVTRVCKTEECGFTKEQTGDVETHGGIWLVDFHMRLQKRHNYRDIARNRVLEEIKLKEAGWCELFQARILPAVCRQRRQLGYNCDACRGLKCRKPC